MAIFAAISATSCTPAHEDEDARLASSVVFSLSWYDPADEGTPVSQFAVSIYDTQGNAVYTRKTMGTKEIASTPIPLPGGSYSASVTDGTFYSTVRFDITGDGMLVIDTPLKRITAQLTVVIEGAPSGATLKGSVLNASSGWKFAIGSDGNIALQLSSESTDATLPSATATDGVITTSPAYVMPTVPTDANSIIMVEVTDPDGTRRASTLTCDPMLPAGKYTVRLNYNDISTPLTLSTVTINQWETLFIYNVEILNPVEIAANIHDNATRTAVNGNKTVFTEGDKIDVIKILSGEDPTTSSQTSSVFELTSSGSWQSTPIMLWLDDTSAHDFYGIYPSTAESAAGGILDVLLAKTGSVKPHEKVNLQFSHAMAKLVVNLSLRDEIPDGATVSVSVDAKAAYDIDLAAQKVSPKGDVTTVSLTKREARKEYHTLLPPQQGITTIKIFDGTKTYSWTNNVDISLAANKVTTVNLNVGNDGIAIGTVTVSNWQEADIDNNGEQAEN